ncbi:MAG: hypothetical protein LAP40_01100 [Acidobacteriia bacterium]|nr:hypothetical protein [Terriglobia bacterium]
MRAFGQCTRWLVLGLSVGLPVLPLAAASTAGSWSGLATPNQGGHQEAFYLVLKQAGPEITGTLGPRADEQYAISEVKMEANRIAFTLSLPPKGVLHFDLTLDGDTLRGKVHLSRADGEFDGTIELKRVP